MGTNPKFWNQTQTQTQQSLSLDSITIHLRHAWLDVTHLFIWLFVCLFVCLFVQFILHRHGLTSPTCLENKSWQLLILSWLLWNLTTKQPLGRYRSIYHYFISSPQIWHVLHCSGSCRSDFSQGCGQTHPAEEQSLCQVPTSNDWSIFWWFFVQIKKLVFSLCLFPSQVPWPTVSWGTWLPISRL